MLFLSQLLARSSAHAVLVNIQTRGFFPIKIHFHFFENLPKNSKRERERERGSGRDFLCQLQTRRSFERRVWGEISLKRAACLETSDLPVQHTHTYCVPCSHRAPWSKLATAGQKQRREQTQTLSSPSLMQKPQSPDPFAKPCT